MALGGPAVRIEAKQLLSRDSLVSLDPPTYVYGDESDRKELVLRRTITYTIHI